jgi:hypothetical protein
VLHGHGAAMLAAKCGYEVVVLQIARGSGATVFVVSAARNEYELHSIYVHSLLVLDATTGSRFSRGHGWRLSPTRIGERSSTFGFGIRPEESRGRRLRVFEKCGFVNLPSFLRVMRGRGKACNVKPPPRISC